MKYACFRISLLFILSISILQSLSAQEPQLFLDAAGKYGYKDSNGNIVIRPVFENAWPFHEGFAVVRQNGKYGYIDEDGWVIIPTQYDGAGHFSEGLAHVKKNKKIGFIDQEGSNIIPLQFDDVYGVFSEGLIAVNINKKWGFIDNTGRFVISAQFDEVRPFDNGLAWVKKDNQEGYIDRWGNRYVTQAEGIEELNKSKGLYEFLDDCFSSYNNSIKQDSSNQQDIQRSHAVPAMNESTKLPVSQSITKPQSISTAIDYADKMVDVDAGIPAGNGENYGTYAVVIGNEEYLDVAPVANAANDGRVMREYLVKTLGVPESNIIYFENASSAVMDRALSVLEKKADAAAGVGKKFNVIFYYSGHGVPSDDTQEAYLLPVDVSPSNLKKYGLPLSDVYRRLGALNAQCVTVFLDACFSGAGRDNRMLAEVKGVQLEPKKSAPTGNMVVLSACSGRETANIFKEGKHGLFTYWLLRKLKETKGNVTLGELQEHLQKYVDYTATNRLNLESGQKPTVQTSPTLSTDWRAIRLR